jgi:lipopolysaccharide/colanic/teichoic acid biosynthesis glycosyltransferase
VTPNLPLLRKVYYAFSSGKKRAISFPEALGRLYYCGFEICNYETSENFIYFVAKKITEPAAKGNPLYGPLIKLKRVGKGGKIINVYKLRTMHPYSEFIQKYVYEKNQLAEGGKIKRDFRVTSWGKYFRKYWLDEWPMLINLMRGDLKIVGVRPISAHYLSLYSEELRQLRHKFKPGILPPFYYDLPKTLDEIIGSEIRYLMAYSRNPVKTDIKYFFRIIGNILLKKARSN